MSGTVLILGANGRFGRHATDAFWNRGWHVRPFNRKTDTLAEAASDADVIVNGWNPPYTDWAKDVPRLTAEVIEAAKVNNATVILPGNVYVFGQDAPQILTETTTQRATNPLGRIRIEMEAAYRAAGVQTIVLRAGDYIDTEASGNWFDDVITKKTAKGIFLAPGARDVEHAWGYLPDVARAAVLLAERRATLAAFEDVPFPGYTLRLTQMKDLVEQASGTPQKVRGMPWWALKLAIPFWGMAKHLIEMRYLWNMPHRLDDTRFKELLPKFRDTDPLTAIATAIAPKVHPDQTMPRGLGDIAAE